MTEHRFTRVFAKLCTTILLLCSQALSQSSPAASDSSQQSSSPQQSSQQGSSQQGSQKKKTGQIEVQTPGGKKVAVPASTEGKRRFSFVFAPIPISSPALGTGAVPVAAVIFPLRKNDTESQPSAIGAAGLITNNGTRAYAVAAQLYFKQDTYRATAAFFQGNLNYDLYGIGAIAGRAGLKLPLTQEGSVFLGEFLRRLKWKVMVGPRVVTGHSLVTIRQQNPAVPIPPDVGLRTNLTAVGFTVTRDTRTNRFYPNNGTVFVFTSDFFGKSLGSKYSFQSFRTLFNKYWGLTEKQVLAYNAYFCATGGEPPFYGNCIYGTSNELRGYTAGRYLDRYMIATQLEYRLQLPKRFGLVAFGGIGGVSPGADQFFQGRDFLPAGGGGLRFLLSKQYHVNLRADLAAGKGGHTFSLGLSEAF